MFGRTEDGITTIDGTAVCPSILGLDIFGAIHLDWAPTHLKM
ncbi:MAG: hypothetical protein UX40_C0009G0020 [Microgenomates group bacterium GW2011_GWF2_46_18]|nr:MAG: hypothetical protein UX40_C0009G0020 [Microgenomates group bacterium GW2011_GWF2_46_18]